MIWKLRLRLTCIFERYTTTPLSGLHLVFPRENRPNRVAGQLSATVVVGSANTNVVVHLEASRGSNPLHPLSDRLPMPPQSAL